MEPRTAYSLVKLRTSFGSLFPSFHCDEQICSLVHIKALWKKGAHSFHCGPFTTSWEGDILLKPSLMSLLPPGISGLITRAKISEAGSPLLDIFSC